MGCGVRVLVRGGIQSGGPGGLDLRDERGAVPYTERAAALRWLICRCAGYPAMRSAARAVEMASSMAAATPAASLRMWVAYRPPRRAATATISAISRGCAWIPGG